MKRACGALALLAALAPSVYLAWSARDMPHLGYFHDAGLYWVCARSLAQGHGYRLESLPGRPWQTKYPPLYPALLALVWRVHPSYPDNLPLAALLAWLMLAPYLLLARRAFVDLGLGARHALVLSIALALNPYVCLCAATLLSELPFSCLVLGSLALAGRARSARAAALAGLAASAAYLTRTAAGLLLVVAPVMFVLRKEYRRAAAFTAGMLPGVAAWGLWVSAHRAARADSVSLYYTDYLGYYFHNLSWQTLPFFLWKNLDSLLSAIGGMLVFGLDESWAAKALARVLAVAALAGTVRLWRRRATPYHAFAAAYIATLLVWHYPPDERLLAPVFPLLLAGFSTELLNLVAQATGLRSKQRRVAAAIAGCLAALALARSASGLFRDLPEFMRQQREVMAAQRPAFRWIAENLPPEATLLAYFDPVLYLETGRRACRLVVSPVPSYLDDRAALERTFRDAGEFARAQGLSHALLTPADFTAELPDRDRAPARALAAAGPRLLCIHESTGSEIYRVR